MGLILRIAGADSVSEASAAGRASRELDELVNGTSLPAESRSPGRQTGGLNSDPTPLTISSSCSGLDVIEIRPDAEAVEAGEGRPVAEARERVDREGAAMIAATVFAFCLPLADDDADGEGGARLKSARPARTNWTYVSVALEAGEAMVDAPDRTLPSSSSSPDQSRLEVEAEVEEVAMFGKKRRGSAGREKEPRTERERGRSGQIGEAGSDRGRSQGGGWPDATRPRGADQTGRVMGPRPRAG